MDAARVAVFAAVGVAGAYLFYAMGYEEDAGDDPGAVEEIMNEVKGALGLWAPPAKYAGKIAAAEAAYGIPDGMLARLLYQECRWRQDIISGRTKSPVGAIGIAQFMPDTAREWGVDPYDTDSSIDGAGRYLRWLRRQVSSWAEALAAYNWGIGNIKKKGIAAAPRETRTYYTSILKDTGYA